MPIPLKTELGLLSQVSLNTTKDINPCIPYFLTTWDLPDNWHSVKYTIILYQSSIYWSQSIAIVKQ